MHKELYYKGQGIHIYKVDDGLFELWVGGKLVFPASSLLTVVWYARAEFPRGKKDSLLES